MSSSIDIPADQQSDGSRRRSRGFTYNPLKPESVLFPHESHEAYLALREELVKEFSPQDDTELACVDQLALAAWREQRMEKFYNRALQLAHLPRFAGIHRMFDRCLNLNRKAYNFFLDQFLEVRARRLRIIRMLNPPDREKKSTPLVHA